jgi:hypothetical protein
MERLGRFDRIAFALERPSQAARWRRQLGLGPDGFARDDGLGALKLKDVRRGTRASCAGRQEERDGAGGERHFLAEKRNVSYDLRL